MKVKRIVIVGPPQFVLCAEGARGVTGNGSIESQYSIYSLRYIITFKEPASELWENQSRINVFQSPKFSPLSWIPKASYVYNIYREFEPHTSLNPMHAARRAYCIGLCVNPALKRTISNLV
jgi:hypothetical protein